MEAWTMGLEGREVRKTFFLFAFCFFLREWKETQQMLTGVYQSDTIINGFNFIPISLEPSKLSVITMNYFGNQEHTQVFLSRIREILLLFNDYQVLNSDCP